MSGLGLDYLFTSESVSEGHPDKVADQISDAILDKFLTQDKHSRVACETLLNTGLVVIAGEISSKGVVDFSEVARDVIKSIGYDDGELGFDYKSCAILNSIDKQSPDIAIGVNKNEGSYKEQGAGDQGMMFGYACDETQEYMPATISYAHKLLKELADQRHSRKVDWLRPDAKSQITAEYKEGKLTRVDTVVVSTQHSQDVSLETIKEHIIEDCIKKIIPSDLLTNTKYFINPTGRFVIGGPKGDAGLTGRKIIVDTYGGHGAHGGGAFSGKDPTKVDRSAAYMGRYIAKHLVAAGLAKKCLVQLAYAIGVSEPVSVCVETYGTSTYSSKVLADLVRKNFDLTPQSIINSLSLLQPIYQKTATYGHFGRTDVPWEKLDKVSLLKQ
ncbi:MAG: methionine adenosyltransferase [Zetaproteobacteria bacterium]|nr:methionine adenosyltransferase [Pseudobdellovibrionaceae bacterium]|tara:strand:- start:34 stop:1188 length:1155 start_codon:yes stop_codon:yes gene_type:complete